MDRSHTFLALNDNLSEIIRLLNFAKHFIYHRHIPYKANRKFEHLYGQYIGARGSFYPILPIFDTRTNYYLYFIILYKDDWKF